jgi:hypothetical protein
VKKPALVLKNFDATITQSCLYLYVSFEELEPLLDSDDDASEADQKIRDMPVIIASDRDLAVLYDLCARVLDQKGGTGGQPFKLDHPLNDTEFNELQFLRKKGWNNLTVKERYRFWGLRTNLHGFVKPPDIGAELP